MHKLTFFPIGNADCCLIDLESKKKLLIDYAHTTASEDPADKRIDLAKALRDDLDDAERDYYDVVVFTHADKDHVCGAGEFFELEHAEKYQGGGRIKMREMWVPANLILEEGLTDDGRILRAEARHRLRKGNNNIRVFSRPEELENWLKDERLTLDSRKHLITDAGQMVPGYEMGELELFVHSPFCKTNDGTREQRNAGCIVLHATFRSGGAETRVFFTGDAEHDSWTDIITITEMKGRTERLEWDLFNTAHHTSYTALAEEKGVLKTKPSAEIDRLYREYGQANGYLISTSEVISDDYEQTQPPHPQAANYYEEIAEFVVTMQHPTKSRPDKLIFEIGPYKAQLKISSYAAGAFTTSCPAPRAGHDRTSA